MCGRLNVTDSPGIRRLCEQLEISLWPDSGLVKRRFLRATDRVSIVLERDGKREMHNAIWWLLLDKHSGSTGTVFKPSRYTSFNTRSDKLNVPRSAGYKPFREQRCVIPAAGFGETLGKGASALYHDLIADPNESLAMGGLYRWWQGKTTTGDPVYEISCSVVTLPPHPALMPIHNKASPLMLSPEDNSVQRWLDSRVTTAEALEDLLTPRLRHTFTVIPVDKPSSHNQIGDSFSLSPDT